MAAIKGTNLFIAFQPSADDAEFKQRVEPGPAGSELGGLRSDGNGGAPLTLSSARQAVVDLRAIIGARSDIAPKDKAKLDSDLQEMHGALDAMLDGVPASERVKNVILNLVHWWPVIVASPYFADQPKAFAYTCAAALLASTMMTGTALSRMGNGRPFPFMRGALGNQANELHLYTFLINFPFLIRELGKKLGNEAVKRVSEYATESIPIHVAVGAVAGAVLAAPFLAPEWPRIAASSRRLGRAVLRTTRLSGPEKAESERPAMPLLKDASRAVRTAIEECVGQLNSHANAFAAERKRFTENEQKSLTRTMNLQMSAFIESVARLNVRLNIPELDAKKMIDLLPNLRTVLFYGSLAALTVYLVQPDKIGEVELGTDATILIMALLLLATNHKATPADVQSRGRNMGSVTLVVVVALLADLVAKVGWKDKYPNGLIASSDTSPYYAAAVMSLMVMTLSNHLATGGDWLMEKTGEGFGSVESGAKKVWSHAKQFAFGEVRQDLSLEQQITDLHGQIAGMSNEDRQSFLDSVDAGLVTQFGAEPDHAGGRSGRVLGAIPDHVSDEDAPAWMAAEGGEADRAENAADDARRSSAATGVSEFAWMVETINLGDPLGVVPNEGSVPGGNTVRAESNVNAASASDVSALSQTSETPHAEAPAESDRDSVIQLDDGQKAFLDMIRPYI